MNRAYGPRLQEQAGISLHLAHRFVAWLVLPYALHSPLYRKDGQKLVDLTHDGLFTVYGKWATLLNGLNAFGLDIS
jgi:hypothetical protein